MKSYHHFTLEERENLQELLREGKSIRQIAKVLKRAASTISREIKRNQTKTGKYQCWFATCAYIHRRKPCKRAPRIVMNSQLYNYICEKLNLYWSPEIIAEMWKREHPDEKLSFNTIYRAIAKKMLLGVRENTHLRRRGKFKFCSKKGKCNAVKPEHLIHERPDEANNRSLIGHWEGDTVLGGIGKGLLVTLVDRKSRFLAAELSENKSSACVNEAIIKMLKQLPVHSITLDNGSEFSDFKTLQRELDTTVYFAKPHAPWQRGTNENLNDCLRFFFPKGFNFKELSRECLLEALLLLNNRPRKCLGWLSPAQVFFSKCCT